MIREEIEKLRGTTFTKEELKEVIIPMLTATKLTKATFKKAMQIFADEFNNYFKIGGDRGATWVYGKDYSWEDVRDKIYQQVKSDWNDFVDFIDSRLDDEVLDRMIKDGILKEEEIESKDSFESESKKHTSSDEWKKLEVYVKPGCMDPTVFVPVLISDDKTLCICPSIKLYKASISDITLKLEELERSYRKRLGIPVQFVLEPCDYDFANDLRDRGFENIIVPKKADSADFYKIFEVSN